MATSTLDTSNTPGQDFLAHLPTPPSSSSSTETVFLLPRSRSPANSHYRPFSTIVTPPDSAGLDSNLNASPSKLRRKNPRSSLVSRPLSSAIFPTMGFMKSSKTKGKEKEKEKEREREREKEEKLTTPQGRDGFLGRTVKTKRSMNSLVVLNEEGPPLSSTPPAIHTPSLAASFAESSTAGYSISVTPPLETPSSSSTLIPDASHTSVQTFPFPSTIPDYSPEQAYDDYDDFDRPDRYEAKENWVTRKLLRLHPYGDEAPYMQSYDSVALNVDRHMHILLRRINSNGTPSFYNYAKHDEPLPTCALDLGCGQGYWLLDAAAAWPTAQIVGFDLVDIALPEVHGRDKVNVVRGNFVRYPLPFPSNTFDFVRIANLSLAIPTERWEFVLSEVYRVLQVGGRLELIDDEVLFPYGKKSSLSTAERRQSHTNPALKPLRRHSASDLELTIDDEEMTLHDVDMHQDKDGDMADDAELKQSIQNRFERRAARGVSFWAEEERTEEEEQQVVEAGEELLGPCVVEDGSSDCPSSPETSTTTDAFFLDMEDSSSSASSLQDPEDVEEFKPALFLQPPTPPVTTDVIPSSPGPAPRRPLPPIPVSPTPTNTTFAPTPKPLPASPTPTDVTVTPISDPFDDSEDDLLTPTKLDITLPTTASVLASSASNPASPVSSVHTSHTPMDSSPSMPPAEVSSEWMANANTAKAVEAIFSNMLQTKYGMPIKAPNDTSHHLRKTFGDGNVRGLPTMHLSLAPTELEELMPKEKRSSLDKKRGRSLSKVKEHGVLFEDDEELGVTKKLWKNIDWDSKKEKKAAKKEKSASAVAFPAIADSTTRRRANTGESSEGRSSSESFSSPALPGTISAKAAGRLGITYSALAAASGSAQASTLPSSSAASLYSNNSSGSVTLASTGRPSDESRRDSSETQASFDLGAPLKQSPGLLLWPSTFIPMHASELEMHACKHMHTLLGCKNAIFDWLLLDDDGNESNLVPQNVLEDAFWEYDSFRRHRLNWPSEVPEASLDGQIYNPSSNIELMNPTEEPKSADSTISTFTVDSRVSTTFDTSIGPYDEKTLTHVRTLRVYFGVKTRKISKA